MCLNFKALDVAEIRRNIRELVTPSKKTSSHSDPIWGAQPKSALPFIIGQKKHGKLIEQTIIKLARSTSDWDGVKSYKLKIGNRAKEYDNIVFNKKLKIIIVLESKRDVNQVSGPYTDRVKQYIALLPSELKRIGFFLLTGSDYDVYFATFNAYGAHKKEFCGKPVIEPKDLDKIFSTCVGSGWKAFEKEKYNYFKKIGISMNEEFKSRVSDYDDFTELKKSMSDKECNHNDIEDLINLLDQKTLIQNILGEPIIAAEQ